MTQTIHYLLISNFQILSALSSAEKIQVVSAPEVRRRTVVAEERRVLAAGRTVPSPRVVQRASSAGATAPAPRARDWVEIWGGWRLERMYLRIFKDLPIFKWITAVTHRKTEFLRMQTMPPRSQRLTDFSKKISCGRCRSA